jgi:hypothetical protein
MLSDVYFSYGDCRGQILSQITNSSQSTLECPPFTSQQTFFILNKRDSLARNEQTCNMFDIKRC